MDNFRKLHEKYQSFQKFNCFHSNCPEIKTKTKTRHAIIPVLLRRASSDYRERAVT